MWRLPPGKSGDQLTYDGAKPDSKQERAVRVPVVAVAKNLACLRAYAYQTNITETKSPKAL